MNTTLLSFNEVIAKLESLLGDERRPLVEFLDLLADAEERRIPLELGYPSTWLFLTKRLNLPETNATRRITASRLLRRFPVISRYLIDGRLNLTTLGELRDVLDVDNVEYLLERASGLSKAAVQVLVAAERALADEPLLPVATGVAAAAAATPVATEPAPAPPPPTSSPPPSQPPELHRFQLVVTREFLDDLEEVKALLSHKTRGDTLAAMHEALRVAKAALLKKKLGSGRPGRPPKARSRHVATAVKVPVWGRDEGKCTFVGEDGRVCGSTFQVQFQHTQPYARGGLATVDGMTLLCAAHNALAAEKDFGKAYIERRRAESEVHSALVNLGFKKEEARQAIAHSRQLVVSHASLDELLRQALRALTKPRPAE